MERVLEPELMDQPDQALAYASSDFSVPHAAFVEHFRGIFPGFDRRNYAAIADLGCGTADVTIRLAEAFPNASITGIDGAEAMLIHGRRRVEEMGLNKRVTLVRRMLPDHRCDPHSFEAVVSNSTLHHLPDPQVMWRSIREIGIRSATVMVMDLVRPSSDLRAQELVALHAHGAPERMRVDFFHSLKAAFTPEEVEQQLREARMNLEVELVSDRHMLIHGHLNYRVLSQT